MGFKGKTPNAERIDLHGMTVVAAIDVVSVRLQSPCTVIHIVTGKGNHSGGVSPVASAIKKLVHQLGYDWRYARLADGGTGVLIVSKK